MKIQGIKKFGLLALAMMLLTGCYNGWGHQGSSSSSSQSPSSEPSSSEDPTPEPVVFDGVDLTYELDAGPVNALTGEKFQQILTDTMGDAQAYESLCERLNPYLLNCFFEHNHLTDEELAKVFPLINTITAMSMTGKSTCSDIYNIIYCLASINTDHLIGTLQEVWADKLARAYLISFFEYAQSIGYSSANEYFEGGDAEIKEMARKETLLLEGTPELRNSAVITYNWFSLIETENIEVAFRFLRRLSRCLVINLSEKEIGYLVASMTQMDVIDIKDTAEEIMDDILGLIHRCGQAFIMFNINAKSYEAIYTVAKKIVEIYTYSFDGETPIDGKHANRIKSLYNSFFNSLSPKGLRVLVKFLGDYANGFTQEMLEALNYEPEDDEPSTEPIYQCFFDLYNELFGLLEMEEKDALKSAFNAFGLDFDLLSEEIEDAVSNPDAHEAGETLEDIMERLVSAKIARRFQVDEEDVYAYTEESDTLILRQGTEFTRTDFLKYLREFRQWRLSYNDRGTSYAEVNRRDRNNLKFSDGGFDTETTGLKYITFTIETSFSTHGPEDVKLTMPYYVVSSELEVIPPVIQVDHVYKGRTIGDREYAIENGQAIATSAHKTPVLLHNYSYNHNDSRSHFDLRATCYIYNTDYKMFVDVNGRAFPSGGYNTVIDPIDFSVLDTSKLGINFAKSTMSINYGEDVLATIPVYYKYKVVEDIVTFDHNTPETPIK